MKHHSLTFTNPSFRGQIHGNTQKLLVYILYYLIKTFLCMTCLMHAKVVWNWRRLRIIRCTVALGTWTCCQLKVFITFKKERSITAHTWQWSIRISKVDFRWESVDWAWNKCPLPALMGVRIKRVSVNRPGLTVVFFWNRSNLAQVD